MPEYLGKHLLRLQQHIMIPEPKHAIPSAFEYLRAPQVVLAILCMLPAIKLDNQPDLDAREVGDESNYRVLAAKAQAKQLPIAEVAP